MAILSWPQLERHQAMLGKLANPTADQMTEIMEVYEDILVQTNRAGILAGTDAYGRPMTPLAPSTLKKRKGVGPPLAPQGLLSRVIANFRTAHGRDGAVWVAIGAWENVISLRGVPFLPFHFKGSSRLPRRDLAAVRPEALRMARLATRAWLLKLLRS